MGGFYHQNERDDAAIGCVVLIASFVAAAVLSMVLHNLVEASEPDPMDGTNAGANAVTLEEFERKVREAGASGVRVYRNGEEPLMPDALYSVPDDTRSWVVLDKLTNVEYLLVERGNGIALTPRLDDKGSVIVMPRA